MIQTPQYAQFTDWSMLRKLVSLVTRLRVAGQSSLILAILSDLALRLSK